MTNPNKTLIAVVMDRSGSMASVRDATIEGFNSFLKTQQETPGECQMYYAHFDDVYELVHRYIPIKEMPFLERSTYVPRGLTALFDAIGKTINEVGCDLAALPENERPGKVLFVIQTDGAENASREYVTLESIRTVIERQQNEFQWEFVFLGANIDAPTIATAMGMMASNAMTYSHDRVGTQAAFASTGQNVRAYRSAVGGQSAVDLAFTEEQRKEANK